MQVKISVYLSASTSSTHTHMCAFNLDSVLFINVHNVYQSNQEVENIIIKMDLRFLNIIYHNLRTAYQLKNSRFATQLYTATHITNKEHLCVIKSTNILTHTWNNHVCSYLWAKNQQTKFNIEWNCHVKSLVKTRDMKTKCAFALSLARSLSLFHPIMNIVCELIHCRCRRKGVLPRIANLFTIASYC